MQEVKLEETRAALRDKEAQVREAMKTVQQVHVGILFIGIRGWVQASERGRGWVRGSEIGLTRCCTCVGKQNTGARHEPGARARVCA